ncbi:MAG: purine-binding chemotaxis protein CheW [Deltaproteobacteria bacterium]|nr:purine-binding chemotaxis protein CheW [Deltaproteobacteria bacterium]
MTESTKTTAADNPEIQLVVFILGNEEFALDIAQVKEIIRIPNITPMPKAPDFIEGIINLRGQIIAVMDPAKRFGLPPTQKNDKSRIVVVDINNKNFGLIVDAVPEVLRLARSNIDPAPDVIASKIHAEFIRGVGKLKNRLIVLLDVSKILTINEMQQVEKADQPTEGS